MKGLFKAVAAVVMTTVMLAGCRKNESRETEARPVKIWEVGVSEKQDSVRLSGKVIAQGEEIACFSSVGQVEKIYVKVGDRVKAGTLLAKLDERNLKNTYDAAKARYEQVDSEVARVKELYSRQSVTRNDYEKAIAGLEQVEAIYRQAEYALSDINLHAKHDGVVNEIYISEGEITTSLSAAISIVNPDIKAVETFITTNMYLRSGDIRGIEADAASKHSQMTISSISQIANSNQLYRTILSPVGKSDWMVPGMIVGINFRMREEGENEEIQIPSSAVINDGGEAFVWVIRPDMSVERRNVNRIQLRKGGMLSIEGLRPGDRIVSVGGEYIHEGDYVKAVAEKL